MTVALAYALNCNALRPAMFSLQNSRTRAAGRDVNRVVACRISPPCDRIAAASDANDSSAMAAPMFGAAAEASNSNTRPDVQTTCRVGDISGSAWRFRPSRDQFFAANSVNGLTVAAAGVESRSDDDIDRTESPRRANGVARFSGHFDQVASYSVPTPVHAAMKCIGDAAPTIR